MVKLDLVKMKCVATSIHITVRCTLDSKSKNQPAWSSYKAYFDNPIYFIDSDGNYELPASVQKNYPLFTNYIKNNISQDVMGSTVILQAFDKHTSADNSSGKGNLTQKEVLKTVTWESGPMIVLRDNPGGLEGANGFYNQQTGQIELSKSRIEALEKILGSNASQGDKLKALSAVYMLVLHETTHYGDYLDGIRQDGGEPGEDFEDDVWRTKTISDGEESFPILYFDGDKYNPDDMQQIMDKKMQTEEGKKTFLTVPNGQ